MLPCAQILYDIWCTRCKKEGHHPDECKADWRMIQEAKVSTEYGNQEQREIELSVCHSAAKISATESA
jgi:hypothetical protein